MKLIFWILFFLSFGFAASSSEQHNLSQQDNISKKCKQLEKERNKIRYFSKTAHAINSGLDDMMKTDRRYTDNQLNEYIRRNYLNSTSLMSPYFQSCRTINEFLERSNELIQSYPQ